MEDQLRLMLLLREMVDLVVNSFCLNSLGNRRGNDRGGPRGGRGFGGPRGGRGGFNQAANERKGTIVEFQG